MGAIIKKLGGKKVINRTTGKPFPESIQQHMKAGDKRRAAMKKAGYKGPKHAIASSKTKGDTTTHRLKEVWEYNPYRERTARSSKVKKQAKKVLKKAAPLAAAGAAGVAYGKRDRKFGGGLLKKIGKILSKKKPVKKDSKPDFSNYPTSKNIHKLIAKEQDPFVRHKLISIRDQAEKGTVIGKGGNVIQTPTKERTAKTLMERHPGSYQRKKPEGKK